MDGTAIRFVGERHNPCQQLVSLERVQYAEPRCGRRLWVGTVVADAETRCRARDMAGADQVVRRAHDGYEAGELRYAVRVLFEVVGVVEHPPRAFQKLCVLDPAHGRASQDHLYGNLAWRVARGGV